MKITIPDDLYKELEKNAKAKGITDTNEYIASIIKNATTTTTPVAGQAYSADEETAIKKRLSDLGYLD